MKDVKHLPNVQSKLAMLKAALTSVLQNLGILTSFPLVVKYIGEIRSEVQKKYEVNFEKHITELGRIREAALSKGAFSAAANAEVARGKAAGLYIEQKISLTGKIEDLSIEELEAKMKKIYEDNKVLVEGEYKVIDG